MKKKVSILFLCVILCMVNVYGVFGRTYTTAESHRRDYLKMYREKYLNINSRRENMDSYNSGSLCASAHTYLNGVLIRGYSAYPVDLISNKFKREGYYPELNYIIAEDLRRYGFDVTWDEDLMTLTVKKIPGVQPAPLTQEEAEKMEAFYNQKEYDSETNTFSPKEFKFSYDRTIRVIMEGYEIPAVVSDEGALICAADFIKCYGRQEWDAEKKCFFITVTEDRAGGVTVLSTERVPFTEPLSDYVYGRIPKGVKPHYSFYNDRELIYIYSLGEGNWSDVIFSEYLDDGSNIVAGYIDAKILKDLNIKYTIADKKLTILPQSVPEIDLYWSNPESKGMNNYGINTCVDLKLFAGEKELGKDDIFPPLLFKGGILIQKKYLEEALGWN